MTTIILWWLMLEVLGFLALPLTFRLFGSNSASGYPFAKVIFIVVWTFLVWQLGFLIPVSTALYASLFILAVLAVVAYVTDPALRAWLTGPGARTILNHDALWTLGFAFFLFQRSMVPDINGAEKYMDFAFLNSLLHTETMPPPDPWMSGGVINYYYFGYLIFANLARLFAEPMHLSYNLCVATIGGLAFSQTAAAAFALTQRWGFALLGGALSAFLGNLDGAQQFIEKGTWRQMDVWRASRVVGRGDTINEFPFFSTIHGDLHPHFIALPVAIAFLAALLDERIFPSNRESSDSSRTTRLAGFAFVTFLLATMVGISTWELPLGAVALTLLAGRAQPLLPLFSRERLLFAAKIAVAVVLTYVLFLPFYTNFNAPPNAPAFKIATSSLGQFLLVFGHLLFPVVALLAWKTWQAQPSGGEWRHLIWAGAGLAIVFALMAGNAVLPLAALLIALAVFNAYRTDTPDRAAYLLIATAAISLLACELFYLRDSYGERLYRMNTVFKLYFQAWTILAIATPWTVYKVLTDTDVSPLLRNVFLAAMSALIAAAAIYPIGVTQDRLAWGRERTLDGNFYLQMHHGDDYAIIQWLRDNAAKDAVIVEASGNPYSYFARFSSNTGLPTIMGWANHEGLWRAHDRDVGKRKADVARIYDSTNLETVRPLLRHYNVKYILVGELERKHHPAGLEKFGALRRVFAHGQAAIYEVG